MTRDDGQVITVDEWKLIQQSAVIVTHAHLDVLSTSNLPPSAASLPWKKVFYRRHSLKEWLQAVRALEVLAPLLFLCGGTWKAEKALTSVLQDKPSQPPSHAPRASTPALGSSHSHASTPAFPSSHSHAHSAHSAPSHPHSAHSRASTPGIPPSSVVSDRSSSNVPTSAASSACSTWGHHNQQRQARLSPPRPSADVNRAPHETRKGQRVAMLLEPTPEEPSLSPRPAFLSLVQEGAALSLQANAVPTVDLTQPLPPKTPHAKASRKGASTHQAMAKTHVAPSDTDMDTVPLASKDSAGKDGTSDPDLTWDELLEWVGEHNIESQGKRASKKDIIKVITQAPQSEQPSQEELEAFINKSKSKRNAKAAYFNAAWLIHIIQYHG
ncbi:hypothetical protein EI94DRAFT_1799662 [Lactarius quietus]|nr:hypothetical protein EI94DRAFT_1799662 [Lactarius quietus]